MHTKNIFWKMHGIKIIITAIFFIILLIVVSFWHSNKLDATKQAGITLFKAISVKNDIEDKNRLSILNKISKDYSNNYHQFASLKLASLKAQNGDIASAKNIYRSIINNKKNLSLIKDLAAYNITKILLSQENEASEESEANKKENLEEAHNYISMLKDRSSLYYSVRNLEAIYLIKNNNYQELHAILEEASLENKKLQPEKIQKFSEELIALTKSKLENISQNVQG